LAEVVGEKGGRAVVELEESSGSRSPDGHLPSIDQRVLNDVIELIYEQRLRPGTTLGEKAFASSLSVSRASAGSAVDCSQFGACSRIGASPGPVIDSPLRVC